MAKDTRQLINELRQDLHGVKPRRNKRQSLMEMVFNTPTENEMDNPGYDAAPLPNEPMDEPQPMDNGGDMTPIQGQVPSEQTADPEVKAILSNIRLAVIKGLAKLAEKPETIEYDVLKKILAIVDRPIETQAKSNGQK